MDILILIDSFHMGGAENQALLFAGFLKKTAGIKVAVWGGSGPGRCSEMLDHQEIEWRSWDCSVPAERRKLLLKVFRVSRAVRKAGPKVILSYGINSNVLMGLAWRFSGAKLFIWSQRHDGAYFSERRVEAFAMRLTPRFIAISETTRKALVRIRHVPEAKIFLIYNGISLDPPLMDRTTWRERYRLSGDTVAVGMLANFTGAKDHLTLVRAWSEAVKLLEMKRIKSVLFLAGRPDPGVVPAKALAEELGLKEKIIFTGEVEDRAGFLGMLDLAVISSHTEGLSSAAIEYMAAGLPVTGTRIPAIEEVLSQENLPYLVPPGDPAELGGKIAGLIEEPDIRERLGSKNHEKYTMQFTAARMYTETFEKIKTYLH